MIPALCPASSNASASGLFNMMRNLGGSIGIALLSALLTVRERFHSNRLGEDVSRGVRGARPGVGLGLLVGIVHFALSVGIDSTQFRLRNTLPDQRLTHSPDRAAHPASLRRGRF